MIDCIRLSWKFNALHAGSFFMLFLSSAVFFSKSTFSKNSFKNTIRVSNRLDPDQNQCSVGPDLGSNCLQRSSADDKIKERVKMPLFIS